MHPVLISGFAAIIAVMAIGASAIAISVKRRIRLLEIRLDAARRRLAGTRITDPAIYRAMTTGVGVAVERITPSGAVPVWYASTRGMNAPDRDRALMQAIALADNLNSPIKDYTNPNK